MDAGFLAEQIEQCFAECGQPRPVWWYRRHPDGTDVLLAAGACLDPAVGRAIEQATGRRVAMMPVAPPEGEPFTLIAVFPGAVGAIRWLSAVPVVAALLKYAASVFVF